MDLPHEKPLKIHLVNSTESPEFTHLTQSLTRSSIIGLDAEWKPIRGQNHQPTFPTVSLLQLACQLDHDSDETWCTCPQHFAYKDAILVLIRSSHIWTSLPYTIRCNTSNREGKGPKETKSLATICKEVLGISLSKELQCSDWSHRPLTEEQKIYAATDAHCLLKIFNVFQDTVVKKGNSSNNMVELHSSGVNLGLKEILEKHDIDDKIIRIKSFEASHMFQATVSSENGQRISKVEVLVSRSSSRNTMPMGESLLKIVRKYGEKILLRESDRKPKAARKKVKKRPSLVAVTREKQLDNTGDWQGPPPWDLSLGGDGCPKFLCDVMVEGLAKHLRCVGVDAAIPSSRKPESRELLDQAYSEQRVLLTRDAKLLRHQYLIKNQIYRVKNLLKNEQLLEVIETFQLQINEDQLMSRCTKCNGRFIQKPLTTEEAVEAAKGFQKIPDCLFNKNLEFWQCMECNQLYWEGTQYHNAVQKFIDVCKLNE
ncbi:hypothetical protein OIU84_007680 [Salix udensis]|uniref:3'-5' exonuclease domain-containing protein n=1 Tax=Salix udensis TaxID=889485 RepID=A0AAD6JTE0_9ROSI|nr:hypothetical protein OIU84_007680 [Salix udensis]